MSAKSSAACECVGSLILPYSPTERAALLCLGRQPLGDALQVKCMATNTPYYRTVVTWKLAIRRTAIKRHPADAAYIIPSVPGPGGYCMPALDIYLEVRAAGRASLLF